MIGKAIASLDWRVRLGAWAGCVVVGAGAGVLAARWASNGPWWAAVLAMAAMAWLAQVADVAWPKLPDRIQDRVVGKWRSQRAKATKTMQGRFVWRVGRTACWMMAAHLVLARAADLSGAVLWIPVAGYGAGVGFFGVEGAAAAGAVVLAVAHFAALAATGVDMSVPVSRESFMGFWRGGQRDLSWIWAFAILLAAPAWFGAAAAYSGLKRGVTAAAAKRRKLAADRRRIEERRERMRERHEAKGADDPIGRARAALEAAQERVRAAARAANGSGAPGEGGHVELTGVERLENENMEGMLAQYARAVRAILASERSAAGSQVVRIDTQSVGRRGFDRALQNMPEPWVTRIRESIEPAMIELAAYYDELCGLEQAVAGGGDGEIVTTSGPEEGDWSGDGSASSGMAAEAEPSHDDDLGGVDAMDADPDADEDDEWGPDPDAPTATAGSRRELDVPAPMMLADAIGVGGDGAPTGEGVLPLADDHISEVHEMTHGEHMKGMPEALGDDDGQRDDGIDPEHDDALIGVEIIDRVDRHDGTFGVVESDLGGGSPSVAAVEGDGATGDGDGGPAEPDEPEDPDAGDGPSAVGEPTEPDHASETSDAGASAPVPFADASTDAVPEASTAGRSPVAAEPPATASPPSTTGTEDQRHGAAGRIMAGAIDRDFVVATRGWFADRADGARAIRLDEGVFALGQWEAYARGVSALGAEDRLREVVDREGATPDELETAARDLEAMGWDHDAALVSRATVRASDAREAARVEDERVLLEARAEEARVLAAAEADRVRIANEAERARVEREAAEAAEAARLAEEERVRVAEEARVAEETRVAALESRRLLVAAWITAGHVTADVLDDGPELFPDVESLAAAMRMDPKDVRHRFDAFIAQADGRRLWASLQLAFADEDANMVESLLERREELAAYEASPVGAKVGADVEMISGWVKGMRERERVRGLTEGEHGGARSGLRTRKQFLVKQNRIPADLVALIDDDLPREMMLVSQLTSVISLMPNHVPEVMNVQLAEARSRLRGIAARVVERRDGRDVTKEYLLAFLPNDVRQPGVNVWDTLLDLAEEATDADLVATEPRPPEPVVVEAAPVADDDAGPDEGSPVADADAPASATSARMSLGGGVTFDREGRKTLEQVHALDAAMEVTNIATVGNYDVAVQLRSIGNMTLRNVLSAQDAARVVQEGDEQLVPLKGGGYLAIRVAAFPAPVWRSADGMVYTKDVKTGAMLTSTHRMWLKGFVGAGVLRTEISEEVRGLMIVSPILTDDGLVSFGPMMDQDPTVRIVSVANGDAVKAMIAHLEGLRV